jgi:flagellar protein FlgJ
MSAPIAPGGSLSGSPTFPAVDRITPAKRLPQIDRSKVDPQLVKAAEGMEAMFLDYLMQTMRKTVPKSELDLESPATEIYRSMLDSEMAQKSAKSGGVGLADQLIAYMLAERYDLYQDPSKGRAPSTGGTNEGRK